MDLRKFLEEEVKKFLDDQLKIENSSEQKELASSKNLKEDALFQLNSALAQNNSLAARKIISTITNSDQRSLAEKKMLLWNESQKIRASLERTRRAINEAQVKVALQEYAHTKNMYDKLPTSLKREWFEKIDLLFKDVHSLSQSQKNSFVSLKKIARQLIESLDKSDIHSAEQLIIDAKHQLAHIPKEYESQRQTFENIFSQLSSRIVFVKQHPDANAPVSAIEHKYHDAVQLLHTGHPQDAKKSFEEIVSSDSNYLPAKIRLEEMEDLV